MPDAEKNDCATKQGRFAFARDTENGCLIGPDGCPHDSEAEALFFDLSASCGCGNPSNIHRLLVDCLSQFHGLDERGGVEGIEAIVRERPDVVAEFIGHYLNGEHLANHGGSVYGSWLTERGKQFLEVGPMVDED